MLVQASKRRLTCRFQRPNNMNLIFYLCFVHLLTISQANSFCEKIITPADGELDPYFLSFAGHHSYDCEQSEEDISCYLYPRELPYNLAISGGRGQKMRLGCYAYSNSTGVFGKIKFSTKNSEVCNLQRSTIQLSYTEIFNITVVVDVPAFIRCVAEEDDWNVFDYPSEEVDSREKGIGPHRNCDCGKSLQKQLSNRIINGTAVLNIKEYPWMVVINNYNVIRLCGGSIITKRHVITAAHCVYPERNYQVLFGDTNLQVLKDSPSIAVTDVIRHENYDSDKATNDIAILELESEIPKKFYMPICIPRKLLVTENQHMTALGWGEMGFGDEGKDQSQLHKTHVRLVNPGMCEKMTQGSTASFLRDRQICTFSKHSSTTSGDSGGPYMYNEPKTNSYNLVGITSVGTQFENLFPTIQTAVHHYYDWIIEQIEKLTPGKNDKCNISL